MMIVLSYWNKKHLKCEIISLVIKACVGNTDQEVYKKFNKSISVTCDSFYLLKFKNIKVDDISLQIKEFSKINLNICTIWKK